MLADIFWLEPNIMGVVPPESEGSRPPKKQQIFFFYFNWVFRWRIRRRVEWGITFPNKWSGSSVISIGEDQNYFSLFCCPSDWTSWPSNRWCKIISDTEKLRKSPKTLFRAMLGHLRPHFWPKNNFDVLVTEQHGDFGPFWPNLGPKHFLSKIRLRHLRVTRG